MGQMGKEDVIRLTNATVKQKLGLRLKRGVALHTVRIVKLAKVVF
jgi:hypothetical protein